MRNNSGIFRKIGTAGRTSCRIFKPVQGRSLSKSYLCASKTKMHMRKIRILANDGLDDDGKILLDEAGIEVVTEKVEQAQLADTLKNFDGIIVRSATKVRKDLIDQCPNLKVIARAGVGLDNIDVEYAKAKGIEVINTPAASSQSVAELVFAHLFTLARSLHSSNREMPLRGNTDFKRLKSAFSNGFELRGKTIGIIGFGRIGREVARIGVGLGMRVLANDPFVDDAEISLESPVIPEMKILVKINTSALETLLAESDFISLHVPNVAEAIIGRSELQLMKDGAIILNASRGGAVDEDALLEALNNGKIRSAALDVFQNEPTPRKELLSHPALSLSPHIGASTVEAQANIGRELAELLIGFFEAD